MKVFQARSDIASSFGWFLEPLERYTHPSGFPQIFVS